MVASWIYHNWFIDLVGQTYYNPLARSWELLVGVLLALWMFGRLSFEVTQFHFQWAKWGKRAASWTMFMAGLIGFACGMTLDYVDWMISGCMMIVGWRGRANISACDGAHAQTDVTHSQNATFVSWMGCCLIATSLLMVPLSSYPLTMAALLLTIGTAALIAAGPRAWVNRVVLSHPFLVAIGKRSYALYLLHYPLYSLECLRTKKLVTDINSLMIITLLTLVGAWAIYRWVEQPARQGKITALWIAAMTACGVLGWMMWSYGSADLWFMS
jgi:peptidoglycan/LPS O-acetylase OafA/YrhL